MAPPGAERWRDSPSQSPLHLGDCPPTPVNCGTAAFRSGFSGEGAYIVSSAEGGEMSLGRIRNADASEFTRRPYSRRRRPSAAPNHVRDVRALAADDAAAWKVPPRCVA